MRSIVAWRRTLFAVLCQAPTTGDAARRVHPVLARAVATAERILERFECEREPVAGGRVGRQAGGLDAGVGNASGHHAAGVWSEGMAVWSVVPMMNLLAQPEIKAMQLTTSRNACVGHRKPTSRSVPVRCESSWTCPFSCKERPELTVRQPTSVAPSRGGGMGRRVWGAIRWRHAGGSGMASRWDVPRRDSLDRDRMGQRVGRGLTECHVHRELGAVVVDDGVDIFDAGIRRGGQSYSGARSAARRAGRVRGHTTNPFEVLVVGKVAGADGFFVDADLSVAGVRIARRLRRRRPAPGSRSRPAGTGRL